MAAASVCHHEMPRLHNNDRSRNQELSLQGNWFMISLSSRAGAASGRSVSTSGGGGLGGGPCCRLGRGGRRSGRWLWLAAGAMPVASCSKRGMVVRGERMCYVSGTLAERPVKEHRKFLFRKRTCDPTASGAAMLSKHIGEPLPKHTTPRPHESAV